MGNKPSTLISNDSEGDAREDAKYPLHAAAREGCLKDLESLLLEAGKKTENAMPNLLDGAGQTPLHLAADRGHLDCVKTLILNGAKIDAVDHDGISVLQAAVISGNVGCCRVLLAMGADAHHADQDGDTPYDSAHDDRDLQVLFEKHETSPLELDQIDPEFARQLKKRGISVAPSATKPVDVKMELQKLEQPIALDLDDDGDI